MQRTAGIILVAASCFSCGASAQARDWAFVQSAGGLAFDAPYKENGAWVLPVRCDVSGLKAITTKPATLNSALGCSTVGRIEGHDIMLTVVTHLASAAYPALCPPVNLGTPPKGHYVVFYSGSSSERVKLGEVDIAL
jgi:hypothetical protein